VIDDGRPAVLRRPVEEARDLEDFAWRQAQVDLHAKVMSLLARLGVWVLLVFLLQVATAGCLAYLVWRAL
jgi:hypothetical protein